MCIAAGLLTHWDHDKMTNIFADIFKVIFICENCYILIQISLKLVLSCPFHNSSAILYIMVWHWTGDKPLSESTRSGWLQSNLAFLSWKFKVKVRGGVKCQGDKVSPISYWFISLLLHSNQTTHSWKRLFQNLPLKIQGQGHGWSQNMGYAKR